ncbi:rust resistance kinase Lr10-like [Forsythia ovata]|uniref:non-specific serine/threonine protein kinase n=1 Tax=Forsythia ovata TaxID=205694 RepID=A0ABD1X3H3_9LAMI
MPSSCGDITINYHFRLKTAPQNCRYPDNIFVLDYQNNQTILNSKSRTYHVQEIHYNNYTICRSDPGLDRQNYSSCPIYSSIEYDLSTIYIEYIVHIDITFENFLGPINNPIYVENAFYGNKSTFSNSSGVHSYVKVGSIMISDMEENCTFDRVILASADGPIKDNTSYLGIHDLLAYGFELLWYRAMCRECESSNGACSLEKNEIRCHHYCYEDTPLSERGFLCK